MRFLIALALAICASAQPTLQKEIETIASRAEGKVAVACSLPGTSLNCDVNPRARPPMQSVFKLPLAIVALRLTERGQFSLNEPIRFRAEDRILPRTYSPLQDKYPEAEVDIPLRELLRLAVSMSDNVAADIVLRLVGGPQAVDQYIKNLGIGGFHLEDNEARLHREIIAQYRNWFEPAGAAALLQRLAGNSPLRADDTAILLGWMHDSPRAPGRIKGLLPQGTPVMHKPGTSGVDNGVAHATNDIGLIALPDGRRLAIAIFITDSKAPEETRDSVIAQIARRAFDSAVR